MNADWFDDIIEVADAGLPLGPLAEAAWLYSSTTPTNATSTNVTGRELPTTSRLHASRRCAHQTDGAGRTSPVKLDRAADIIYAATAPGTLACHCITERAGRDGWIAYADAGSRLARVLRRHHAHPDDARPIIELAGEAHSVWRESLRNRWTELAAAARRALGDARDAGRTHAEADPVFAHTVRSTLACRLPASGPAVLVGRHGEWGGPWATAYALLAPTAATDADRSVLVLDAATAEPLTASSRVVTSVTLETWPDQETITTACALWAPDSDSVFQHLQSAYEAAAALAEAP